MTLLAAHALGKHFGERVLFENVTFDVGERDKIGLVGDNGCGKTTLFRLITGEMRIDEGEIVRSKEARIGYLEQHACRQADRTLWDEVQSVFAPLMAVEEELETVNARLSAGETDAALIERQHLLQEQFQAGGGLYYKSRVRATLLGLGFDEAAFTQPVGSLSGGQRSKAAMGRLLLSDTNLLLLDEPTNHLDIPSVEWLEEFLHGYTGAVVVISHDRYFLDKVTNRTFELAHGRLYTSNGGYTVHKAQREKDREVEEKHYKTAVREIRRMEESIARFRQFNREKSIRAAESKQKALDRFMETVEVPEEEADTIRFDFTAAQTSGNEVIVAGELAMGFGERELFHDVGFQVNRRERVFLLGPNGCGKTTLLKILKGELEPRRGFVRLGAKVTVGYYDQTQAGLDESKTAIDEIWDAYPHLTQTEIRNALAAFLFRGDEVFKPISLLSGGERARLLLLKLMLARDNLLLLDEPTNHLDIASCEALEEALSGYDGTMFIVSHDRYFINRMADKMVRLTPEGCETIPGNYDTYIEKCAVQEPARPEEKPVKENAYRRRKEQEAAKRRLAGRIRRTEEEVTATEQSIAALHARLESEEVAADYALLMDVTSELEKQSAHLDELMTLWEQLQLELEEE